MKTSLIDNFERLSFKEKTMVLSMASIFLGFILFLGIYLVVDTLDEMEILIEDSRNYLEEIAKHQEKFLLNKAKVEALKRKLKQPHPPLTTFLDEQAKKFLSSPLAFRIDKKKGKVYLSALFQKTNYGKMFVAKYGIDRKFKGKEPETRAVLNFISKFVSEEVKSYLELGNYTVQFIGYNWTINDGS